MIVIGVDPGSIITGVGIVEKQGTRYKLLFHGTVQPKPNLSFHHKLKKIYDEVNHIIDTCKPTHLSLETVFYGKNIQSALKLGHVRGCILTLAMNKNLDISEFSPREIKKIITGKGNASKKQVAFMVKRLLNHEENLSPYDVTDALAAALCMSMTIRSKTTANEAPAAHQERKKSWKQFLEQHPEKIIK